MKSISDIFTRERAALAPLAGITDSVYRRICAEFGASPVMTEMVSSEGYIRGHGSDKSRRLLRFHASERPIGYQFFGSNAETIAEAARRSLEFGPDFIDLNAGCPMKKVIARGAGSALLLDLLNLGRIVQSVTGAVSPVPVTVKIRSGWDHENINAVETAKVCFESGAQAIIVHPRPRSQLFSGHSDWSVIRAVKEAVSLPVIGCGDIRSAEDARRMLDETGADAVMIGRGAMGRPWIFRQVAEHLAGRPISSAPGMDERFDLALRHMEVLAEEVSERFSVLNMRKFFAWYSKGMVAGAEFRQQVFRATSMDEVRRIVDAHRGSIWEGEEQEFSFPDTDELQEAG
ncbi:MAG: tRNA dihydrouridine synthase DusB [Candidatus Latescibacterota bacterium]